MPTTRRGNAAIRRISDQLAAGGEIQSRDVQILVMGMVSNDYASLREAARTWKLSAAYLSDVLNGKREPGPKILRVVGLEKRVVVRYAAPKGGD